MTLIDGFAFAGYRSFPSDQTAELLPLGKVNLIAGQNNTGKSNILRVIADTYTSTTRTVSPWDRPLGDSEHTYSRVEFHAIEAILSWSAVEQLGAPRVDQLREFLDVSLLATQSAIGTGVWFPVTDGGAMDAERLQQMAQAAGEPHYAGELSSAVSSVSGGGAGENAFGVLRWIMASRPLAPSAFTVGGVRTISAENDEAPDLNGQSIKRRLLELQNPSTDRLNDKELFAKVQEFVRTVLDDLSTTIDIPHDLSTIHVTQGGRTLPIENLGTGVHEVVIIAAAATITQHSILCIEEPEVHLHPVLQRKLLRYLASSTTNQYFIATHSAHMLDSEIGKIFHVSREDGVSRVRFVGTARERAAVCADLGYRPSDLVQTNAVLWVEGPSDRIYLKHWIDQLAPGEFVEGTHYSVMFYGGALLSALSPLDAEEVDEFISLRNLNRFMLVMMDSDKTTPRAKLNESKRRVINGLEEDASTSMAWVTAGYTIENYVPSNLLTSAIHTAHPNSTNALRQQNRWENPLASKRLGIQQPSKVAIAKSVTANWTNEWPLDLKSQAKKVIDLIRRANSHT